MFLMQLVLASPKGSLAPIECDSVHITVAEDENGKQGGNYGIRNGHVKSVFAVEKGTVTAFLNGETVFSAENGKGFATVDKDLVTVVVENYKTI